GSGSRSPFPAPQDLGESAGKREPARTKGKTMEKPLRFNVSLITDEGKWPSVGTAYGNRDGSFNLYLRENVTLSGPAKLQMRVVRPKAGEAQAEKQSA